MHLQDKNSEDSAFELCFDAFGRLQRDRYDLHIDNMVERFDRAIHDNGSGLEKAHDFPYQITLSFWGKIDPAEDLTVDQPKASIAGRPYQIMAVKAVMERFEANYPAALLVMSTGKTRTAASIVDMMMGANRATRILFLADRVALVTQAMRTFGQLLPDLPIASVGEAVKNGYLVDYRTREVKLKFSEEGIHYGQLSPEEQARFEKLFAVEAGEDTVPGSAINKWFFNVNIAAIVKALNGNVA